MGREPLRSFLRPCFVRVKQVAFAVVRHHFPAAVHRHARVVRRERVVGVPRGAEVDHRWPQLGGRRGRGGIEFRVADCDEALQACGCADGPLGGGAGGGGLEVGVDGGEGGVVVACDMGE